MRRDPVADDDQALAGERRHVQLGAHDGDVLRVRARTGGELLRRARERVRREHGDVVRAEAIHDVELVLDQPHDRIAADGARRRDVLRGGQALELDRRARAGRPGHEVTRDGEHRRPRGLATVGRIGEPSVRVGRVG